MRKVLNAGCFCFAILGCSYLCHIIGTLGHNQGVDPLLIAGTILPLSLFGMGGIISKFVEE